MNERSCQAELEALPTDELYRQARRRAVGRLDVGFFWSPLRAIPAAEAAAGDLEHVEADVGSSIMSLGDLRHAGEGELGEALRPLYIGYPGRAPSNAGALARSCRSSVRGPPRPWTRPTAKLPLCLGNGSRRPGSPPATPRSGRCRSPGLLLLSSRSRLAGLVQCDECQRRRCSPRSSPSARDGPSISRW
jgi:hypothetical protein